MGLVLTVTAGVVDMLLNALFIIIFRWGIVGAAVSSVIGQLIGSIVPMVYFLRKNSSLLRFVKPAFDCKALLKICTNGSSEMVTMLCSSMIGFIYNFQLMRLAGENGVAAYGVIIYANAIFYTFFMGYSTGSAPIVSYHYGGKNDSGLRSLCRKSLGIVGISSIVLTGYDTVLSELARHAFALYSISFVFCGFNIWCSGFFTALNNGFVSAAIAFGRTFLFQGIAIIILPYLFGLNGVWTAVIAAEALTFIVALLFFIRQKQKYNYA